MRLELKEILIALEHDHDGRLVIVDGLLVAVLVKLSDVHGDLKGRWTLETGYGLTPDGRLTFSDLDSAVDWIRAQLASLRSRTA